VGPIRCHYNYIKPHQRLRFGQVTRTPAMQAGIFDRAQSWRGIFAWPPKPPTPAQNLELELSQSHTSCRNQRFVPTSWLSQSPP